MQLSNTLFVCATLIAAAVAQTSTTTSLHFTAIPTSLVAGEKTTIGWAGGNGNSVNIILQQGLASNLQDVPIPPIASGVEGTSTTWTPPKSLPDAGNYALRIEQGDDTVNYSGMLQLFGGCSTCPTNAAAAFASSSASKSLSGSATPSSPSSTASPSSKSGVAAPIVSSGSKSGSNSTAAAGTSGNSTITGPTNSTMGTGSMNMTMSGTNSTTNSTLSSAKLHATSSKSSSSTSSTSTSSSTSSSSSSESTSSSTGSSASPSATKKSSGVTVAASNFALVLCAIVGVVYLG